ncbi:type IVB secretion system protein IcmH/DotU [Luteibacter sp. 329MFSha]|uniref:type IVB secretion system protein IcmH/DotU n=1 Tax=Luteibacter sp. 329MFSha TaxID=1798239 RepID=UPI0008CAB7BC|nr:type IVB secretion system protein IcmH/DotU [Luteibacter sp. 329MFSha]SEW01584.1 type VI secretion system protein ImpK [Luteibacter sp. 329MFSha]
MRRDDRPGVNDDATIVRPSAPAPEPVAARPAAAAIDAVTQMLPSAAGSPILRAANPLLLLAAQLRHSGDAPDPTVLRDRAIAGIRRFDDTLARAGVDGQTSVTARYVLCTMLDEAVLESPWGERTGWQRQTLLVTFHGEAYGGEKFFVLLDRLTQDMVRHADLVELMYLCLALGFGGRYLVEPGGVARLADRREDVYRRITAYRSGVATELSPRWRGLDRPLRVRRGLPAWMAALGAACLLVVVWIVLHGRLNGVAEPVGARLAAIGLQGVPLPASAAPAKRPPASLRALLADDERSGALGIDEKPDGQAVLRLAGTEMFPSGGADVAADRAALLSRIARALNQVRGRVVVVGHTDDQPIRSLRFKDNMELSAARARNVGAVLARDLTDPRRIETSGAGASQPVATPADVPANRARNRRVDILFVPEAG